MTQSQALTSLERQTIYYLASGYSIRETATVLNRSPESTNLYIKSAKQKLDARSLDHLVALAVSAGLI